MTIQQLNPRDANVAMENSRPNKSELKDLLNCGDLDIEWLAGDGSDRSYYRLKPADLENTYVLMKLCGSDAEALKEGRYDWIAIQKELEVHGVVTPKLIRACPEHQCIIIEDYGNVMFETCVKRGFSPGESVQDFYMQAGQILVNLLKMPAKQGDVWTTRSFDAERLSWELDFFYKHFVQNVLEVDLDAQKFKRFSADNQALSAYLAPLSKYFCHRDFHSRNLMVRNNVLAVIDFQDARMGAAAYDLVSLCFDAYVPLSVDERLGIMKEIVTKIRKECGAKVADEIEESWPAVFLQRQLKAIGSFGYLTNVKNKPMYLAYVPKALSLLEALPVSDKRWSFLSDELLDFLYTRVQKS